MNGLENATLDGYETAWLLRGERRPSPWFMTHVRWHGDTLLHAWMRRQDDQEETDQNTVMGRFNDECRKAHKVRRP